MPPYRHRSWSQDIVSAMSSPPSASIKPSPSGSRIGRPPQWTISRSRKLARLYVYTTLSIEKIIKVLEDDVFKPRKNSAQKTIHKMLDNDPRYLRPDSRIEMNQRIGSLAASPTRNRLVQALPVFLPQYTVTSGTQGYIEESLDPLSPVLTSPAGPGPQSPSFASGLLSPVGFSGITEGLRKLSIPMDTRDEEGGGIPEGTDISQFSVADIQRRVSDCSTNYAQQVSALLKRFSISSQSDTGDDEQWVEQLPPRSTLTDSLVDSATFLEPIQGVTPNPGHALCGDYLGAFRWHCTTSSDLLHTSARCWCAFTREMTSIADSWLLPTGQLSDRARFAISNPSQANVFPRDQFGNTHLHLIASLAGYRDILISMILHGADPRGINNSGQTFLHVLHEEWFADITGSSAPLNQLLGLLQKSAPGMVYDLDVYGRTFFHHARSCTNNPAELTTLFSAFDPVAIARRDAFGNKPLGVVHQTHGAQSPYHGDTASPSESRPSSADEHSFLAYHARLVQVIQSSYNDALVEDAEGRNGLHCLAEAIINQQTMDEQRSVMASGRSMKRKVEASSPLADQATASSSTPSTAGSSSATTITSSTRSNAEGTLLTRLRHLESLTTHSTHPVDIHHYDRHGSTVLMAFITHISDDQDDKSKTLVAILETLIHAGGSKMIEARNRRGETALLVAARLGRKAALTTLLENGANVYARDARGRGVLEVVDETCRSREAREDLALYARLEACRVLLTGRRDWGVVARPSVVMEWGVGMGLGIAA